MEGDVGLTLGAVLTAAGAAVAAALIVGVVQIFKTLFGSAWPGAAVSRAFAFVLSALIVAWAYIGTNVPATLETLFGAFVAWYAIARLAMAEYDDVTAKVNSLRGPIAP